jgi:hypothetical protein
MIVQVMLQNGQNLLIQQQHQQEKCLIYQMILENKLLLLKRPMFQELFTSKFFFFGLMLY